MEGGLPLHGVSLAAMPGIGSGVLRGEPGTCGQVQRFGKTSALRFE